MLGAALWQGTEEVNSQEELRLIFCAETSPTNNHVSELGSRSSPAPNHHSREISDGLRPLTNGSSVAWEALSQRHLQKW